MNFDRITYVGDQTWDYHASRQLGIHFIGIGEHFKKLTADITVFDNFNDPNVFLENG